MDTPKENKNRINVQYLKKIAEDFKHIKQRSHQQLQIQADSQVLDVGCGPATDTVAMSQYIGSTGRIVGVDNDPEMIKEADLALAENKVTKNVKHLQADVSSLPFGDGEFDRVHAERLFQVLPASVAGKVIAEMTRVLRSGGRVSLVDTDWGSVSVNFSDSALERRLMTFFATKVRPNGFAGRQLLQLLHDNGYVDIVVEVIPVVMRDFGETPFGEWLTTEALKQGAATKEEMENWNTELTKKTEDGKFFYSTNMVLVSGCKRTQELSQLMDVTAQEWAADVRKSRKDH